jgi:hypothetical protein
VEEMPGVGDIGLCFLTGDVFFTLSIGASTLVLDLPLLVVWFDVFPSRVPARLLLDFFISLSA